MQADQRRNLIITTAIGIANRNGLVAATPSAVARACSIKTAKETVHYHFKSRGDLWKAIAESPGVLPHVRDQARSIGVIPATV